MSDYKKKTLEQLEDTQKRKSENLSTCFDSSKSTDERLSAFKSVGSIVDDVYFGKAVELVFDPEADDRLRAAALERISHAVGKDEALLSKVINMLNDKNSPDVVRQAALSVLQVNSFSSPIFPAMRPDYMGALRSLVDDENRDLGEAAIETLALNKDEYVQRRLLESLENPEEQITKPEMAIQFLSYDLHADHFPVLRKLATESPDVKARTEALRNLAADSDSIDILEKALENNEESPEVRHICAVALQNMVPSKFLATAEKIIEDDAEDEGLQIALLNTLMHTPGTDKKKLSVNLNRVMERTQNEETKSRARNLSRLMEPEKNNE